MGVLKSEFESICKGETLDLRQIEEDLLTSWIFIVSSLKIVFKNVMKELWIYYFKFQKKTRATKHFCNWLSSLSTNFLQNFDSIPSWSSPCDKECYRYCQVDCQSEKNSK